MLSPELGEQKKMEKFKILIVEDELIVAQDIQNHIRRLGYEVAGIAPSGKKAIRMAGKFSPNLVLMDIVLKGPLDGVTAAERIQKDFEIPVVFLTSHSDENFLTRAKKTEPFGYLLKPFDDRELYSAIEVALYRHKMERKLKEREKWLATTLKSIEDGVLAVDDRGFITFMNRAAERLTGWPEKRAVGQPVAAVFQARRPAEESASEFPLIPGESLRFGYKGELILVRHDGKEGLIEASLSSIQDDKAKKMGSILVFHDITDQRREELEKTQLREQVRQLQQIDAIGRVAKGVAHDFANLLAVIKAYSRLSLDEMEAPNPLRDKVSGIYEVTSRAIVLTRQLLAFCNQQEMEVQILDLNNLLRDLEKILHWVIGGEIKLEIALAEDPGEIKAGPGQIGQVILNLAINARDAMPSGGILTLKTSRVEGRPPGAAAGGALSGEYVLLSVADTGMGMTPEVKARVFEPYFTTKQDGRGMGLGLSIIWGIVKQSGGSIEVESNVGQGTTFRIYFPRV